MFVFTIRLYNLLSRAKTSQGRREGEPARGVQPGGDLRGGEGRYAGGLRSREEVLQARRGERPCFRNFVIRDLHLVDLKKG